MSYKLLKSPSQWEIIIKDIDSNTEFSLMDRYKEKCPICYYPTTLMKEVECHEGLLNYNEKFSFIAGHYYETDYKNRPNNWFGELLNKISQQPFKHSHELLHLILKSKILNSGWNLNYIQVATMVPTNNQQMQHLFAEVSESLRINWIAFNELFEKKDLTMYYKYRLDYVNKKYSLNDDAINLLLSIKNLQHILIFDDVLHQGWTFGRIIELLNPLNLSKIYLATVGRTVPKTFKKTFSFP